MSSFDVFLDSVGEWQESHPDICPRCGGDLRYGGLVSSRSWLCLCLSCFCQERGRFEENYDNWAIVVACRAVCGANITLF